MQNLNHNGQKKTRKELREEKTRNSRKGLITSEAAFFFIRMLIVGVIEWVKPS